MSDVVIAIPTFKRPESLERLLRAIENLNTAVKVTVLVADNDSAAHEGFDRCADIRPAYRWPLDAIVVGERGIANVRNALVARILDRHPAEFVAMLDDDETPDPDWLSEFLRIQQQTGADALNGTLRRIFDKDPGLWATHCDGISDVVEPTGPISMLSGTGNLFLRRACFEMVERPWFDPAFALTGGEDKDFFVRLKAKGARFAWADGALAFDYVPQSRANLKWALSRAYSAGNSDMRVFLKYRPALGAKLNEFARIAAALLLNPFLFVILAFNPNRRVRPLRKLYRAFGKIAALGGRYYDEYSVIHGR